MISFLILTGWGNHKKVVQVEENIVSDYNEIYAVLSEKTGFAELEMVEMAEILDRERIPEIVSAEKVEDNTLYGSMMVVQEQTEEKQSYRLYIINIFIYSLFGMLRRRIIAEYANYMLQL